MLIAILSCDSVCFVRKIFTTTGYDNKMNSATIVSVEFTRKDDVAFGVMLKITF